MFCIFRLILLFKLIVTIILIMIFYILQCLFSFHSPYIFQFFLDLLDLEDIGAAMRKQKHQEKKAQEAALRLEARDGGREMVTKLQRRALTKEGYRIIGTHSAVKLCRWTKVSRIFNFISPFCVIFFRIH